MRSEVYFLPPRTSVTDSVGISTLPILSCSPKACTRDSSDSFTLRSNPEYEWIMYHFMFGLLGASAVAVDPSAAGGWCSPSPPGPASFFSSSGIGCFFYRSLRQLPLESMALEIVEQKTDARLNELVDDEKIHRENEDSNDDDGRGGLNFLPGRRGHFAHLGAHVVVERPNPLWPGLHPIAEISASCRD